MSAAVPNAAAPCISPRRVKLLPVICIPFPRSYAPYRDTTNPTYVKLFIIPSRSFLRLAKTSLVKHPALELGEPQQVIEIQMFAVVD
jgi:hypothetical protein